MRNDYGDLTVMPTVSSRKESLMSLASWDFELLKLGKYDKVLESIETVISMDEQEPKLWKAKAKTLDGLGRQDEEKKCLETATKLGPSDSWLLILLTERRDIRKKSGLYY